MSSVHEPSTPRAPLRRSRSAGDVELPSGSQSTRSSRIVLASLARSSRRLSARSDTTPRTTAFFAGGVVSPPPPSSPNILLSDLLPFPPSRVGSPTTFAGVRAPSIPSMHPIHQPEPEPTQPPPPTTFRTAARQPGLRGYIRRASAFLGFGTGNRERKELVGLVWNLAFGSVQFVITLAFVAYSSVHRSSVHPELTEWRACDRPLGIWNSLWLARICLGCFMSFWRWKRDRKLRQLTIRQRHTDEEEGRIGSARLSSGDGRSPSNPRRESSASIYGTPGTVGINGARPPVLPHMRLYARLSLLLSLVSMSWFLTAHILVYTSLESCRLTAPHLWWLTFGILCILYLMVIEILVIAVVVFILGPLAFLFWNLFLICIGRHPLQNPHTINPEIGKLSRAVVDAIPLVLYIPPPPEKSASPATPTSSANGLPTPPTPTYDPAVMTYPPKTPRDAVRRQRFAWLRPRARRVKTGTGGNDPGAGSENARGEEWEDNWERGEWPFVRLEGNRAACAICLMDFEEPRRVRGADVAVPVDGGQVGGADVVRDGDAVRPRARGEVEEEREDPDLAVGDRAREARERHARHRVEEIPLQEVLEVGDLTQQQQDDHALQLLLEDAGEGAQPLRLLPCGHVFHKTCIDPWLIDVSGRCPTCQRAVQPAVADGKSSRRDRERDPAQGH